MAMRPLITSNIIDKNDYTEVELPKENVFLSVITSDKGRDSEFLTFNSVSDLLREFTFDGIPNFKKHGQAIFDAIQALDAGASASIMRVVPDNAFLPNAILAVQSSAKSYELNVSEITTPKEVRTAEAIIAYNFSLKLKNTSPFTLKTKVKLYGLNDVKNIVDFFNGEKNLTELSDTQLGEPINRHDESIQIGTSENIITVESGEEVVVAGTFLNDFFTPLEPEVSKIVVLLTDESDVKGYVSTRPFLSSDISAVVATPVTDPQTTLPIDSKNLLIRPVVISSKSINSKNEFEAAVNNLEVISTDLFDSNDFSNLYPIFGFAGFSKSNEEFSIKLEPYDGLDNNYSFRLYELTVYKKDLDGEFKVISNGGPFIVSFDPDAMSSSQESFFIKDVLDKYFDGLSFYFNEKAYEDFLSELDSNITSVLGASVNPSLVDFLYNSQYNNQSKNGYVEVLSILTNILSDKEDISIDLLPLFEENKLVTKNGTDYNISHFSLDKQVVVTSLNSSEKDLVIPEYSYSIKDFNFILKNGDSGAWDDDTNERVNKIVNGYLGLIDPNILNKRLLQVDLVSDSNQSILIRNAIVNLIKQREDCFGIFGLSTEDSKMYPAKLSALLSSYPSDSFRLCRYAQSFEEISRVTNKRMKVSSTYHAVKKIIDNDLTYGTYKAVAGLKYGYLGSKDMNVSFVPNENQQEELYKNKVNYALKDNNSTYFETQLTSQLKSSPLSDIPTVRNLLKLIRKLELASSEFKYEDISQPETITELSTKLNNILDSEILKKAYGSKSKITVYASDYDMNRKKLRIRVELYSPKFLEQIILDFIIN